MSIYMLCNFEHCFLCCIVTWATFDLLSSLLYLWSIFLLCVTYVQLGASVIIPDPLPHLSGCWSYEWAQYTTHRSWPHRWTQTWDPGAIAPPPLPRGVGGMRYSHRTGECGWVCAVISCFGRLELGRMLNLALNICCTYLTSIRMFGRCWANSAMAYIHNM